MEQFGGPLPTLPILATRLGPGRTAYESSKACDYCRIKKIRCDRKTPCSTCRQRNAVCTTSPRVQRPRRHQEPTSVEYIQRIRILERQLELQSSSGPVRARAKAKEVPHRLVDLRGSTSLEPVDTASPTTALRPSAPASRAGPALSVADGLPVQTQPSQYRHAGPGPEQADDGAGMLEGPTSLSAHSNRAINVLDQMAGIDDQDKHSMEARELVESLRRIVKAIKAQPSPPSRDTYTNSRLQQRPAMPPIEASVAAIRNAQERRDVTYQFLTTLLPSMPLSDVCLRVYFSEEYSDADFIILNAALIYFSDASPREEQGGSSSPSAFEHKPLCRENLDAAISRLPLHLPASFPMVLALILAAIHSVEILKPHIAWTLVSSAYQLSHILGCHLKRGSGVNGWCDASNPPGLMFWVIYFLEKTLCLRLGRCSMIPDAEVTVMLPGGSPGLEYSRSIIKVAQLAGKLYRMLYGVEAFDTFRTKGRLPVEELSRELDAISAQSQENIKAWRRCTTAAEWLTTIDFLSTSDRVIHHSLQTLIHSALPAHCGPSQSFTEPCIASAREALASHQASPVVRAGVQSVFLSSYLGWFIFARPFVPFTVLFCYVIETGHSGDLQRMRQFADSMQSLVPRGLDAASRHRRLFQVFYDVARRYVELKAAATDVLPGEAGAGIEARDVSNPGGNELSHEIDSCLNALGFSSYLLTDDPTAADPSVPTLPEDTTMLHPDAEEFDLGQGVDPGLAPHLPQWFRVSQQMMGLMDNDHVSF